MTSLRTLPRQQFPFFSFLYILMASLARVRLAKTLVSILLTFPATNSIHQVRSIHVSRCRFGSAIHCQPSWRLLPINQISFSHFKPVSTKFAVFRRQQIHIRLSHSLSSFMKTPSVLISTKRQKSKVMPYRPIELLGTHTTMSYAFLSFYFIVWPPSDNPTLFQPLWTSIHQVRSIQTSVDADSAQPFTGKLHEDPFVLISMKRQNSTAMP